MHRPNTPGRLVGPILIAGVIALGITACSEDGGPSAISAADAPDAKVAEAALQAGLEAHAAGDLTSAAASYERTLDHDGDNKFAFYNLALIDEAQGNYGLAEDKYRKALASDPAYEPALFNLAILVTGSDPAEATSLYRKAVAAEPKDASAWMNLGLLLRASGDHRGGDKAVRRAIRLNPQLTDPAA